MPSKLDVVNQILNELGREPVTSIVNTDDASIIISPRVDLLANELLLRAPWNFAIKYISNTTPLVASFSPDFLYSYQLPFDFGYLDRISPQTTNFGLYYRIIDDQICTNSLPLNFYYVVNQVDYSVISVMFQRALVLYTAADVCAVLTNNEALTKYLEAKYETKLNDAIRQNDMQRFIQSTPFNDFDRQIYI